MGGACPESLLQALDPLALWGGPQTLQAASSMYVFHYYDYYHRCFTLREGGPRGQGVGFLIKK